MTTTTIMTTRIPSTTVKTMVNVTNFHDSVKTFCPLIKYHVTDEGEVHVPWFFGALILGIFLGGIFAIILARQYKSKLHWKKRNSEEDGYLNESKPLVMKSEINIQPQNFPEQSGSQQYFPASNTNFTKENLVKTQYHRGMADILLQKSSETIEEETSKQNVGRIEKFEEYCREDKEKMMMICLQKLLATEQQNGQLPGQFSVDYFITEINNNIQNIKTQSQMRDIDDKIHTEREKMFRNDKDEFYLEFEQKRASKKIARQYQKEMKKIGKKLSEENVDSSVIDRINSVLLKVESEIAMNNDTSQKEMMQNLDTRQLIRQTAAEKKLLREKEEKDGVENTVNLVCDLLKQLVSSGEISDHQNKQLMDEFRTDVDAKKKQLDDNAAQELTTLTNNLNQKRNEHLQKLEENHQNLKKMYFEEFQAEKTENFDASLKKYNKLIMKLNEDWEKEVKNLDQEEIETVESYLKQLSDSYAKQLQDIEVNLFENIKTKANSSEEDMEKLLSQKEAIQHKISESKEGFRKEQENLLNEKMEKRMKEKEEQKQQYQTAHDAILNQQTSIVSKMLENNVNLDKEKKDLLLKKHQQKIKELGNQMELSHLKYEQSLQIQINQRRNKLKQIQEEKRNGNNKISDKKLESEIEAAEEKLQNEKAAAITKMQETLLKETESLIEEQFEELIAKIGKLEVGQARRNVLLERQDKTLQKLQEKLGERVINKQTPQNRVNHLVQQHQNNLMQLEEKHKATREHNEKHLQEKIQQKHIQKKQMEDKMAEENSKELQKERGVR
ncbi:titin homolog [Octopus bimaculoides]|uniref:Uncharacterized protein n=1 Tax=Octopus bimaculoides TaxID=37653 RepID=A0A0L8H7D9_OCTBM|nr:titin homolog [Octopus bimaculoides]|eukprot:XP_014774777.1 PREDICTED: rho-associated protein kinase 2-like [Octopus bimaculoides]